MPDVRIPGNPDVRISINSDIRISWFTGFRTSGPSDFPDVGLLLGLAAKASKVPDEDFVGGVRCVEGKGTDSAG